MDRRFRVWNERENKMVYPDWIAVNWLEKKASFPSGTIDLNEFMMSSGVKDANGKYIYEGDVLSGTYNYPGEGWYDTGEGTFHICDVVRFDEGAFKIRCFSLSEAAPFLEVIGNIYENKELSTEDGRAIVSKKVFKKHCENEALQHIARSVYDVKVEMEKAVSDGVASELISGSLDTIRQMYKQFEGFDPYKDDDDKEDE